MCKLLDEIETAMNDYGLSMYEEGRCRGRDEGSDRKRQVLRSAIAKAIEEARGKALEEAAKAVEEPGIYALAPGVGLYENHALQRAVRRIRALAASAAKEEP
jgi:hypothetical protein